MLTSLGHPLPSAGTILAGGRLRVIRPIGKGAMGMVFEAFDETRRANVAVKTLLHLNAPGIYRLKNEFRALADVAHPNLVHLHELFAEGDLWFFTMDLVPGMPFDQWVWQHGMLDESRLRDGLPQLAHALLALHAAGKLHRDLKPHNALVTDEGRVVVLDFGLAAAADGDGAGQTISDLGINGTPAYMAPEQAAGQPACAASDFYALGVMLFEVLTGRLPFEGRPGEILAAKQTRAAPVPKETLPATLNDLGQLCAELLERDPQCRPSAAQLRVLLGLEGEHQVARPINLAAEEAPPLVGREAEHASLRDAYRASTAGSKPVVLLVSGESGIGKTTLVSGYVNELREQGHAVVLTGRCYERESVPFKAIDAIVDELSRYLRRLARDAAAQLMPRETWALRRLFPVLARIDVVAEMPERVGVDAQDVRRLGFLALGELLGRICDRQPLLLWIDDLHWGDRDSFVLLQHLLRQPDAPRMLFIASHRSAESRSYSLLHTFYEALSLDARLDVRQLVLGPLSQQAGSELLRTSFGARAETLAQEAGGNPFLLSELLRHAASGTHAPVAHITLAELLRVRFGALAELERRVLELLSVAATPLSRDVIAEAAGVSGQAHDAIDSLRAALLVRTGARSASVECYHDRIREAVVASLSQNALRVHHRALAEALAGRADAEPEQLFTHFEAAGDARLAAAHAEAAALRAASTLAFDRAASFFSKALELGEFTPERAHDLRLARAEALSQAGHALASAEAYLAALGDATADEALALKRKAGEQYLYCGRLDLGRELLDEALRPTGVRLARTSAGAIASLLYQRARLRLRGYRLREGTASDPETTARLAALRGAALALVRSDAPRGFELFSRHLQLALKSGDRIESARGLAWEVIATVFLGNDPRAVAAAIERAEALADSTGDNDSCAAIAYGRAMSCFPRPDALPDLERCIALHRQHRLTATYHNRAQAELQSAVLRTNMARLTEVAHELPARLDEAWSRGDLCMVPMWAGSYSIVARLATGSAAEVERDIQRARSAWPADGFTFQDFALFHGEFFLQRHRFEARPAWQTVLRYWQRLEAAPMYRMRYVRMHMQSFRGLAAVQLAAETGDRAERADLLRDATRSAKLLPAGFGTRLHVALACARGDQAVAVSTLRSALTQLTPLEAHTSKLWLGMLLGGDEGRALVAEGEMLLRSAGAIDPQHLAATLCPWKG